MSTSAEAGHGEMARHTPGEAAGVTADAANGQCFGLPPPSIRSWHSCSSRLLQAAQHPLLLGEGWAVSLMGPPSSSDNSRGKLLAEPSISSSLEPHRLLRALDAGRTSSDSKFK